MAKIDDLAELLTEEINSCKKVLIELKTETSVIKNSMFDKNELNKVIFELKNQPKVIQKTKSKPDLSSTTQVLNQFLKIQQHKQTIFIKQLNTIFSKFKVNKNKTTKPIMYLLSIITICSLLLSYSVTSSVNEYEAIAYKKGKKELNNYINNFFNDNPTSKNEYLIWVKNKQE